MRVSYLPTGEIVQVASIGQPAAEGCAWLDLPRGANMPDGDMVYVTDGNLQLRPKMLLPELAIPAGRDWQVSDVPQGTQVSVDGANVGVCDGSRLELTFPYRGLWRVDLKPPFPWQPASALVVVS